MSIVPVLKILGYRSNLFVYNSERSIILKKIEKELEIPFKDMKTIIADTNYITEYFIRKHAHKISAQTKERRTALKESLTQKTSIYNPPESETPTS